MDVLRETGHWVAVSKPSGLIVHRGAANDRDTLVGRARARFGGEALHPLHRLDRGTSGVVLFARSSDSARRFRPLFDASQIEKAYLALVRGRPASTFEVDHPVPSGESGQRVSAKTSFRLLASVDAEPRTVSLVLALPKTGRYHQIRRHLKHVSHPIIGDANYGVGALNREFRDRYGLRRLALHAWWIRFTDPHTTTSESVRAPVPPDLREPLLSFGFSETSFGDDRDIDDLRLEERDQIPGGH